MEQSFIQWIVGQVGLGGVAALALYFMNRQHTEYARLLKEQQENHDAHLKTERDKYEARIGEQLENEKSRNLILIETVRGNTQALASVQAVVERCGLVQPRPRNNA